MEAAAEVTDVATVARDAEAEEEAAAAPEDTEAVEMTAVPGTGAVTTVLMLVGHAVTKDALHAVIVRRVVE